MKVIAITILYALIVSSCSKVELNCEVREMESIKTEYGNACVSKELESNEIKNIYKNVNSRTNEFILSMYLETENELKVYTSNKGHLNFNNGHIYKFKKENNKWVSNGEGEWIAD